MGFYSPKEKAGTRARAAMDGLNSYTCACGRKKKFGQSFCPPCYYSLSVDLRRTLYDGMLDGYPDAYHTALTTLREKGRIKADV